MAEKVKRIQVLGSFGGLPFDSGYTDEAGFVHLTNDGADIEDFVPFYVGGNGGTGAGGGLTYSVTVTNLLESRIMTVPEGEKVTLSFNYSSIDSEGMDDGAGIGQIMVNGVVRRTFAAKQGPNDVDVTEYLSPDTNNVSVRITNSENNTRSLSYTITVAAVYLTSLFDAAKVYTGDIPFIYTPTGLAVKTVHFELDGAEIGTATVSASGRQQPYKIPAQKHGAHVLRVWFTCSVAGNTVSSNVLYYNIICCEEGNTAPIIAVTTPPLSSVEQYTNIVKKYRVYDPSSMSAAITLEVTGEEPINLIVDRTEQTWTYRPTEAGELTQTIRCGDAHVTWMQTVTESSVKVEAETEALALHLSSYGRSNNEANPGVWENNGISAEFSNFNFVSDGWLMDEDNNTVLRVSGDARLTIPYKIFAYDFRTTGKTLEFELATRDVMDYSAEVLSCYSGGRGFKITAQELTMASEQSGLGTRYKENEHIRVSIVAEKKSENRLLLFYVNGIMSGAVQYPEDDDFSQATPVGITIGSNDCTTDLYNIRAYDNGLTRHQTLDNWIADTQNSLERLARYKRNDIYDVYGQVVISKLPTDLPYLVLQGSELPQFKDDKKTISGYFTDPLHPEKSYSFTGAQIDVQGTSSQFYYRKNYKIKYKEGFVLYNGTSSETYQMNANAVPTDTFTMKADVASSEGAFNVILSMLYNELCPYKTPAQIADPKVRQTIEGFPCVIFWDNGSELKFMGKYNFNNDKGTEEVFGFKNGDESWEIRQNGTDRVGWHSADYSGDDWKNDFEARYPDKSTNITRLKSLAEWLVTTDTDQATNEDIEPVTYDGVEYTKDTKEYRLAKFSAELSNHFIEEAIIFYYLFTEIFLSIDQREKNAFPTYLADKDRWIVLFYDADSSCGTDNKGNLAFDYYLEDVDYTQGGEPIYNGQNSVLWKNLRATRYDEIAAMYQDMRKATLGQPGHISYDYVIGRFENHQSKWPEAIFNEDMYTKCIEPLVLSGDGEYLPMLQGKKEQWMKWWLYNRFRYLDSKYTIGTSREKYIKIRARSKANVNLTSYVNMYGHVLYNAEMVEHRMNRNQEYEFVWAASGAEDAVIGIYDGDMITSMGDLAPLVAEEVNVSVADHLTSLKVGDASDSYRNYSLNSLTLGNNVLLRHLDVRNCPNLTQSVDISGCTNIEEVYFDGTSITGLKLPNGGILKTLHLPGTMTNLTLRNQTALTEFVMPSYGNVTTLWLENNSDAINPLEIFEEIPENSRVRILGFHFEAENSDEIMAFIRRLDSMRGLDENGNNVDTAQVSGSIYTHEISYSCYLATKRAKETYPNLTITYDEVMPAVTYQLLDRSISGVYENDRVDTIGVGAFRSAAITFADFPMVVSVGDRAFQDCKFLTGVNLPLATSIGANAFQNAVALESIYLPATVTLSGSANFSRCTSLKTAILPAVTDFGASTFQNCPLEKLDFTALTTLNGNNLGPSKCAALILRGESVVPLTKAFANTNVAAGTNYVYVPKALVDSYKAATNWSSYASNIRAIEDYPEICGGE